MRSHATRICTAYHPVVPIMSVPKQPLPVADMHSFTWPPVDEDTAPPRPQWGHPDEDARPPAPSSSAPIAALSPSDTLTDPVSLAQRPRGRVGWTGLVRSRRGRDFALALLGLVVVAESGFIYLRTTRSAAPPRGDTVPSASLRRAAVAEEPPPTAETRSISPARAAEPPPQPSELIVRSDPPGARVSVDGRTYGATPITIPGLSAGAHKLTLTNDSATVVQTVQVADNARLSVIVPFSSVPQSGWISVASPISVQVFEGGRLLGVSQSERIMLPDGAHRLELVNEAVGFRAVKDVHVSAGQGGHRRRDGANRHAERERPAVGRGIRRR